MGTKNSKTGRARRVVNGLLLLGIVAAGGLLAYEAVRLANDTAEIEIVSDEARTLYEAFGSYYRTNGEYPNASVEPRLDTATLDLLRRRGYYSGHVLGRLLDGRADGYDSPDDRGVNQEFWLELTLRRDPRIRFLVARSDGAPLGEGRWRDGAFIYRDGRLEPL